MLVPEVYGLWICASWFPFVGYYPIYYLADDPIDPGSYWISFEEVDLIDIGGTT